MSKPLLSPKELAVAIGASESSVRRWIDARAIGMSRTAGGHRRIPLQEAIRFIRQTGAVLVRPEILGLDRALPQSQGARGDDPRRIDDADAQALFDALVAGERRTARGLITSWYLSGRELAALLDGPVRSALHRVGELWEHEPRGILLEHRATEICLAALVQLRALIPLVPDDAPVALGGAPGNDPYLIPSAMAALILAEAGYRDINYGPNTPLTLLAGAADEHGATLVWVSITAPADARVLRPQAAQLAEHLAQRKITLLLGGRRVADIGAGPGLFNVHFAHSMRELGAFARGLVTASAGQRGQ